MIFDTDSFEAITDKNEHNLILPLIYLEDEEGWRGNIEDWINDAVAKKALPGIVQCYAVSNIKSVEKLLGQFRTQNTLPPVLMVDLDLKTTGSVDRDGLVWLLVEFNRLIAQAAEIFILSTNLRGEAELVSSLKRFDIRPSRLLDKDRTNHDVLIDSIKPAIDNIIKNHGVSELGREISIHTSATATKAVPADALYEITILAGDDMEEVHTEVSLYAGIWHHIYIRISVVAEFALDEGKVGSLVAIPYCSGAIIEEEEIRLDIPKYGDSPKLYNFRLKFQKYPNVSSTEILIYMYNRNYLIHTFRVPVKII